jgi:hypothetical protein
VQVKVALWEPELGKGAVKSHMVQVKVALWEPEVRVQKV